jgi:hypothetical protein
MLAGGTAEVTLDGSASDDGDGGTQTLTYRWSRVLGPSGGGAIEDATAAITRVVYSLAGTYRYRLTVSDGRASSSATVDVIVRPEPEPVAQLRRGDANADGEVDISDGARILNTLFLGDAPFACLDAADSNDSGVVDMSDAVRIFEYLFLGGTAPPPPGPVDCGPDATDDDAIDCASYPLCPSA